MTIREIQTSCEFSCDLCYGIEVELKFVPFRLKVLSIQVDDVSRNQVMIGFSLLKLCLVGFSSRRSWRDVCSRLREIICSPSRFIQEVNDSSLRSKVHHLMFDFLVSRCNWPRSRTL